MRRVAAYCRVSTDSEDQRNSLSSQEKFFREYIVRTPEWELAKVFVDTGISGTSTKKREAFHQMISEAIAGEFDLILTKEISRFARNTLDSIFYTRKLRDHGVGVLFMNDNINTLDADAELRLTILSSIAQEESRKTSDRVKWGQKRKMEQGVVFGRDMLGYDVRNGRLYLNREGAEVVRLIYHKYVNEGKGSYTIAKELKEAGIKTAAYMKQWSSTVILRILRNEKMCGDLIQKKTITLNYLNHQKKYNKGEEEFVILRNHHEPIITRELFNRAQKELARRSEGRKENVKYTNRHCFSGKIKCAVCGNSFVCRVKKRKDNSVYRSWRCYKAAVYGSRRINEAKEETGCNCPSVNEDNLKIILQNIMESLNIDQKKLITAIFGAIQEAMQNSKTNTMSNSKKIDDLEKKKNRLITLYLENEITKKEFQQIKANYENEIEIYEKKQREQGTNLADLRKYLTGILAGELWDDDFYRNILASISAYENNTLIIRLNTLPYEWSAVI